jgi:hypothetical protein
VHGVLIFLYSLAGAANKETLCILLICVRHGSSSFGGTLGSIFWFEPCLSLGNKSQEE